MDKEKTRDVTTFKIVVVPSSEEVLKEAIEKGRWLEGVVFSVVFLESSAIARLRRYLRKKGVLPPHPFLRRMRLLKASSILEELKIINHRTHSLIGEINKYRNETVHELRTPDLIKPNEAKDIIEKALECEKAIAQSYKIEEE